MKISPMILLGVLGCLLSACGGNSNSDPDISLEGKSATEQVNTIVGALCNQAVECGTYSMECSGSPDNEELVCTSSLTSVSYDECKEDLSENVQEQADCWTAQTDDTFLPILEECINAMVAEACITQEEMDIYTDALNAGEDPASPRPQPEACVQLENHEVMQTCERR